MIVLVDVPTSSQHPEWCLAPCISENPRKYHSKVIKPLIFLQNPWFPLSELRPLKQVTADTLTAGAGSAADTTQESASGATIVFSTWTGGAAGATWGECQRPRRARVLCTGRQSTYRNPETRARESWALDQESWDLSPLQRNHSLKNPLFDVFFLKLPL